MTPVRHGDFPGNIRWPLFCIVPVCILRGYFQSCPPPPIGLSHLSIILFCALSTRKFHCLSHLGTIFNIRPRGRQFPKWCTFFDTTRAPGADAVAGNTFLGHEVCIKTKISSSRAIGTVVTVGIRAILTCAVGNHRLGVCIRFSR